MRGRRSVPEWWLHLCEGYLRSLRRRNRRPNTLRAYLYELYDFGEWLLEANVGQLSELSRQHIEAWQDELCDRTALRTQDVAATALCGLLKWAAGQELALSNANLWMHVARPNVPADEPRPLPAVDLAQIRAALTPLEPTAMWRLRTRALFFTLFSTGARISEALSLQRGAVHDGMAKVIQKGGRPHTLILSDLAVQALNEYEARRTDSCPAMFLSLRPERPNRPMDNREAQEGWDALCLYLCIGRFTNHQIRHTTITTMIRNGTSAPVAAKHVGHRGLATIMGYTEIAVHDRRLAVATLDA